MKATGKKRKILRQASFWIAAALLALFTYMNLREFNHSKSHDQHAKESNPMQMINVIAPLPWKQPATPSEVVDSVYYGATSDLSRNIIMTDSGDFVSIEDKDSDEELVDLAKLNNPRIQPISDLDPSQKNPTGQTKVRKGVQNALVKMLDSLPSDVGIAYSGAYVSSSDHQTRFDEAFKKMLTTGAHPDVAYAQTCSTVEPTINHTPANSTGGVIEMTLYKAGPDEKKALLNMGSFNCKCDGDNQETFSNQTTPEQRENRLMLLKAAQKAGFANNGTRWNEYHLGDRMWAYVNDKRETRYGTAEKSSKQYKSSAEYIEHMTKEKNPPVEPKQEGIAEKDAPKAGDSMAPAAASAQELLCSVNTAEEFNKLLSDNADKLILVKFMATWCVWCTKIKNDFEKLAQSNPNVVSIEVDVDKLPEIAAKYNVKVKPTFVFIHKDKVTNVVGSDMEKVVAKLGEFSQNNANESGANSLVSGKSNTSGADTPAQAPIVQPKIQIVPQAETDDANEEDFEDEAN